MDSTSDYGVNKSITQLRALLARMTPEERERYLKRLQEIAQPPGSDANTHPDGDSPA